MFGKHPVHQEPAARLGGSGRVQGGLLGGGVWQQLAAQPAQQHIPRPPRHGGLLAGDGGAQPPGVPGQLIGELRVMRDHCGGGAAVGRSAVSGVVGVRL